MKAAFFCEGKGFASGGTLAHVYGPGRREKIATMTELYPSVITLANFEQHAAKLASLEVIFSTWGMPVLSPSLLDRMPALKAVFYAAGSVKSFGGPLLQRGITVVGANTANAVPVAEFTLAQILLACKGYMRNTRTLKTPGDYSTAYRGPGVYGETVALLGAGAIGRKVMELIRPFTLKVLVVDPYLSDDDATRLGARKVSLEEAFSTAYVVSNHLPNLPSTQGILNGSLFQRMRLGATFINTGRGAQVVESDLIGVLSDRTDLTALLDVTDPEPPKEESELYTLPNVHLTSHIAGSLNDEVVRMADLMIDEFMAWQEGRPLRCAITPAQFAIMA